VAAVGYGLEIAERTGASLVGIDFSVEALRQADAQAQRRGMAATFKVGDLTATGLDRHRAHAVVCVDAMQFAHSQLRAVYRCVSEHPQSDMGGRSSPRSSLR
jgi:2-polyprenyl-3-methyl-5-hydroxy-6-metoxy-1,4-benzoquinol methylase